MNFSLILLDLCTKGPTIGWIKKKYCFKSSSFPYKADVYFRKLNESLSGYENRRLVSIHNLTETERCSILIRVGQKKIFLVGQIKLDTF